VSFKIVDELELNACPIIFNFSARAEQEPELNACQTYASHHIFPIFGPYGDCFMDFHYQFSL
jgi:hypothetical protein